MTLLIEGSGVRIQAGAEVPVTEGDFGISPSNVEHGFRAGTEGAKVIHIFAPPREAYRRSGSGFAAT